MRRGLIFGAILAGVSVASYQLGWWRSWARAAEENAVTSAIERGSLDLGIAWALQRGDVQGVLTLLESEFQASAKILQLLKPQIPNQFTEASQKFLAGAAKYQKQFPESQKPKKQSPSH